MPCSLHLERSCPFLKGTMGEGGVLFGADGKVRMTKPKKKRKATSDDEVGVRARVCTRVCVVT